MILLGGFTVVIDPYFHYHAPLESLEYPLYNQRYQNDGIARHFEYNAIITGTSMTENMKASEWDDLFGVQTVKLPYAGSSYKEIGDSIVRALRNNPDIRMVVRSIDGYLMSEHKDDLRTDAVYPNYLYDENPFNDVSYVLNKTVLLDATAYVLSYTAEGLETPNFDEYSFWGDKFTYGAEKTFGDIYWDGMAREPQLPDPQMLQRARENIQQNVIDIANANPEVTFYCYYPPYSMVWWGEKCRWGSLDNLLTVYELAAEMMLECENIRLYSFWDDHEVIENLDNYKDVEHHTPEINSKILQDMHDGRFLLTKENNAAYWDSLHHYYSTFDFGAYYKEYGHYPE